VTGETVGLAPKALCSMNMWGFTPDYFEKSEDIFTHFLEKNISELKAEFYIPYAIDCIIKEGTGRCELLSTTSRWFGVTFKEDRPGVVAKFQELADKGVYPFLLFDQLCMSVIYYTGSRHHTRRLRNDVNCLSL
jgi:hypothetical protein